MKHEGPGNVEDAATATQPNNMLQEGIDYYIEDGLFVFTATFLQKRGYCCESGCRHLYSIIRSVH
jgi:hypothetical protein